MGRWQCYGLGPLLPREVECLVHSRPTGQDPWERNYSSTKKSTSLVGWSISMEKPRSWRRFPGDGQTTLSLRWAVGALPKKNGKYHRAEGAEPAKTAEAWSGEAAAAIAAQPTSWQRGGWLGWICFFTRAQLCNLRRPAWVSWNLGPQCKKMYSPSRQNKKYQTWKIHWNLDPQCKKMYSPSRQNRKYQTSKIPWSWDPQYKHVLPKTKLKKHKKIKTNILKFGPPIQMYSPKHKIPNVKNTLKFGPPIQTMYCPKQKEIK